MQGIEITLQRDFQVSLHHPGFMQTRTLVSTGELTVDFVHSQTGQTFSDGPLVPRMNVFYVLHQIGNIDHGSILYLPQHEFLLLAQQSRGVVLRSVRMRRNLHVIEREVPSEIFSPGLHHLGYQTGIRRCILMVAFSLIPDASGYLIRHQRINHLIVQYSRLNRPPGIVFQFILCKYLVVFHDVGRCPHFGRCTSPGGY